MKFTEYVEININTLLFSEQFFKPPQKKIIIILPRLPWTSNSARPI